MLEINVVLNVCNLHNNSIQKNIIIIIKINYYKYLKNNLEIDTHIMFS